MTALARLLLLFAFLAGCAIFPGFSIGREYYLVHTAGSAPRSVLPCDWLWLIEVGEAGTPLVFCRFDGARHTAALPNGLPPELNVVWVQRVETIRANGTLSQAQAPIRPLPPEIVQACPHPVGPGWRKQQAPAREWVQCVWTRLWAWGPPRPQESYP